MDSDFTISSDSLGSDLVVSFPSETRNKIFNPWIFIRLRDPLFPVIDTFLPFSSENEDKVVNTGILAAGEEQSPHLSSHRGLKALNESPMMIREENTPNLGLSRIFEASRARGTGYSLKDEKQSQNDNTEHENGKSVMKSQSQKVQVKSKSTP
ncbi:hypothetical protein Tco_0671047 [Tanacetum coccineum]